MININLRAVEESVLDTELALLEKKYKLKLPEDYKAFILKYNGGIPEENEFVTIDEDRLGVACFYSVKYGNANVERVLDIVREEASLPDYFYPFARTQGGSDYVLALDEGQFGEVYLCHYDGSEYLYCASSFEDFIDGLEEAED